MAYYLEMTKKRADELGIDITRSMGSDQEFLPSPSRFRLGRRIKSGFIQRRPTEQPTLEIPTASLSRRIRR